MGLMLEGKKSTRRMRRGRGMRSREGGREGGRKK
jgi:hypothetical protein